MKTLICLMLFATFTVAAHGADWSDSGTVETDHGELHYRMVGTGKPLLLLHGYTGYGDQWRDFLPTFLNDYQVIAVDLPGHGRSSQLQGDFVISDAATAIWQLLDHLEVDQLYGAGYSAGGMTLLQMAIQKPSRVKALILAASAHRIPNLQPRARYEELPEAYRKDLLRNHNGDLPRIRSLLAAGYVAEMEAADLRRLTMPVLIVSGDRDESFPLAVVVETYEALPDARLWVVPDLGHALFWPWGGSERLAQAFPGEAVRFFKRAESAD